MNNDVILKLVVQIGALGKVKKGIFINHTMTTVEQIGRYHHATYETNSYRCVMIGSLDGNELSGRYLGTPRNQANHQTRKYTWMLWNLRHFPVEPLFIALNQFPI